MKSLSIPEPERIARLEHDIRGYPIPWNVERGKGGAPLFTVNDAAKDLMCLRRGLCPICGERLGRWKWWTGGARAAFDPNGWYLDRAAHKDCAEYALQVCPFLAAPSYLSNRITIPNESKLLPHQRVLIDGSQDHGRPPLFVSVCGDKGEATEPNPFIYTRPIKPVEYTFWRHGKQIPPHRAMPILRGLFGADWEIPPTQGEIAWRA